MRKYRVSTSQLDVFCPSPFVLWWQNIGQTDLAQEVPIDYYSMRLHDLGAIELIIFKNNTQEALKCKTLKPDLIHAFTEELFKAPRYCGFWGRFFYPVWHKLGLTTKKRAL
jgi:hypothetical protein